MKTSTFRNRQRPCLALDTPALVAGNGTLRLTSATVVVPFRPDAGHAQPDTTVCAVAVSFRPSADVLARAEDADMALAVDGAAEGSAVQSNAKCRGCKRHRARLMPRRPDSSALETRAARQPDLTAAA